MTSKALRMSPADTFAGFYNSFHALALLVNRRFAEALLHARAAIAAFPEFPGHYNLLICCCSYLEMTDEAKAYLAHHDRIAPPLTCGGTRQRMEHFAHRDIHVEGLAKAGVPE
jgi:adenylate cyclase